MSNLRLGHDIRIKNYPKTRAFRTVVPIGFGQLLLVKYFGRRHQAKSTFQEISKHY